jgi:spermidine/putrescine transport system ATP-binding protein
LEDFLVFEGISKSFGDIPVVKNLSLSVKRGEVFSLLGPSGCGKTTLLRMCAGFVVPDAGRIILNGQDITHLPVMKRPVNTVFQNYALFPHMTVRKNIAFGLTISHVSKKEIDKQVDWVMDLFQMRDQGYKLPSELSGGQKQRVAIARAIINKPQLLLLDEPLAALDLKLRQKMLIELDNIHDEVGITFLYVTHDQGEAMSLSDHMAVMNQGMIEQVGTPTQIYESPQSSFSAAFIGDTNFLEGSIINQTRDSKYSTLKIEGFPDISCFNDQPHRKGDTIFLSLRPEKIRISQREVKETTDINVNKGVVEDLVYLGSLTKYWVRCGEWLIMATSSHTHFLEDEKLISKEDTLWLSWHRDDGFMLHKYREKDEILLTNPDITETNHDT